MTTFFFRCAAWPKFREVVSSCAVGKCKSNQAQMDTHIKNIITALLKIPVFVDLIPNVFNYKFGQIGIEGGSLYYINFFMSYPCLPLKGLKYCK